MNKESKEGPLEERQSNLQQRGARYTRDGASGLPTSLLYAKLTSPALPGGRNPY